MNVPGFCDGEKGRSLPRSLHLVVLRGGSIGRAEFGRSGPRPCNSRRCLPRGGGASHVNYTLEGGDDWDKINGTYVDDGYTISLQPGVPVPVSFESDGDVYPGWASTGGGSFACPTCSSTTFTPGTGGYVYMISLYGSFSNWATDFLVGGGRIPEYRLRLLYLQLPTSPGRMGRQRLFG